MGQELRLGLDFGGVLVRSARGISFRDTPDPTLAWEPVPGAVDGVKALVERTDGQVWIVSKATPRTQARSRDWMKRSGFFRATGLPPANVRFCLEREEKAVHGRELGLTHFVDDLVDVMRILRGVVPNLYRLAPAEDRESTPSFATHVVSWEKLRDAIDGA